MSGGKGVAEVGATARMLMSKAAVVERLTDTLRDEANRHTPPTALHAIMSDLRLQALKLFDLKFLLTQNITNDF